MDINKIWFSFSFPLNNPFGKDPFATHTEMLLRLWGGGSSGFPDIECGYSGGWGFLLRLLTMVLLLSRYNNNVGLGCVAAITVDFLIFFKQKQQSSVLERKKRPALKVSSMNETVTKCDGHKNETLKAKMGRKRRLKLSLTSYIFMKKKNKGCRQLLPIACCAGLCILRPCSTAD